MPSTYVRASRGAGVVGAPTSTRAPSLRVVGLLLTAVAGLYVVAPALHSATVPLVHAELGLGPHHEAVARVVGVSLAMVSLVAAGRAGDALGRRAVLTAALGVLCAGSLMLTVAFSGWFYVLGRIVVAAALAAVFVSCLPFITTVYLPGRVPRVMGGWLAAMSAGFVVAVNLAPHAASVAGWRAVMAVLTAAVVAALLLVRRHLPDTEASREPAVLADPVRTASRLAVGVLAAAGLQLAPLWGWSDLRVGALLLAACVALLVDQLRDRVRLSRRDRPAPMTRAVWGKAVVAGLALGFTQVVLTVAVPPLMTMAGGTPGHGAVALSAFGAGGVAGCLLVRHCRVSPLTGCSLGLPLAALGLGLLHALLQGNTHPLASGCVVVAMTGFGTMLALTPQMARFLTALPRANVGTNVAILPGAILLGTAAAQALPYASSLDTATPGEARELLWVGAAVVGVAALVLGRPAVALVVAGVSALQYPMVKAETNPPMAMTAALAVGAGAGAAVWARREQSERLSRAEEMEMVLQRAVLHPIPNRLGRLHLSGSYRPATAGTCIGGDFLEALHTPFGTRVLLGDVRGKGLQAVQAVTDLLGCFRSQAYETPELSELAARLDRQVMRVAAARGDDELFATALLLQHDGSGDALEIINCGHLAPLAVTTSGPREIDVPGLLPLGFGALDTAGSVRPTSVSLDDEATVVAYTDGLSEARNATGEFYPLMERLADAADTTPAALVEHLNDDVHDWTHHLADDIAIVAVTHATSH
ncbi:MFS transporter [Streptomyces sp. NPDC050264]|uniref:MFS transporter n=1 Tax=Streptomyces sp. NPDC050264 TaxID=3155038 RepID=UPI00341D6CF8